MTLRYFKFLVILFVLFATSAEGQAKHESLDFIRKIFEQTNAEKNLTRINLENEEFTGEAPDGGVSLTGYFKDQVLVKVLLWKGLSYGIVETEYYLSKDSLVFLYVREKYFQESGGTIDHSKVDLKFEGRYYLKHDKLIHKTIKGTGFWNSSDDNEKSLLTDSNSYLKILNAKKKKLAGVR